MTQVIGYSPVLPIVIIIIFFVLSVALCTLTAFSSRTGVFWRMSAAIIITVTLINPKIVKEEREPQPDITALIIDRSGSQKVSERKIQTEAARDYIRSRLSLIPNLELRETVVENPGAGSIKVEGEGSLLVGAIKQALGDIPAGRLAGAIVISDGQAHDQHLLTKMGKLDAPIHLLLTGKQNEIDRRLVIENAPAYGIVGGKTAVTYRVEDQSSSSGNRLINNQVQVTLKGGSGILATAQTSVGQTGSFSIPIPHAGSSVFSLEVGAAPDEVSIVNNQAVFAINGVRERLRVLLVSGQPHAGGRVWRNLLKSDPAVDLIHFTILRPPEKDDYTPMNEMSLISFPTRDLFEVKIKEFDLVIFDRYIRRDVLLPSYMRNIISYVREGGALLLVAGPEFASERSLFNTSLGEVLPVVPTGNVLETRVSVKVTQIGKRHPITSSLQARGNRKWGNWFRLIETATRAGHALMRGVGNRPLLVVNRVDKGRVAIILSDHLWLWARGFEGGGPYAELIRRLAHWLMKEPDLEEHQLRAHARNGKLNISRRSLSKAPSHIVLTRPNGIIERIPITPSQFGIVELTVPALENGLYRVSDGGQVTTAIAGSLNSIEFADLRSTSAILGPLVASSGGSTHWINKGFPDIRRVRAGRDRSGKGWLGLIENKAYAVTGLTQTSFAPPLLFIVIILIFLITAWRKEGWR